MICAGRIPRDAPAPPTTGNEAEKFFTDIGNQVNSFLKNNFNEDTLKNFKRKANNSCRSWEMVPRNLPPKLNPNLKS